MSETRPTTPPAAGAEPASVRPGWLREGRAVLVQSARDLLVDNGPQWAAAIAYYSLLSVFPLLLVGAAVAAFFVEPQWVIERATRVLGAFIPSSGADQIRDVVTEAMAARGRIGILSFATLLWAGSRVFGVVTKALNIAYDADETYGFLKRTLVELTMVVTLGALFVLALASRLLLDLLGRSLRFLPIERGLLFQALEAVAPALLLLVTFLLTYRFVPRAQQDWRSALAGAGAATALVLAARPLFLRYVRDFAQYNLIYGSIAVVIILVLWAWVVALILLFGGELASHVQAMVIERRPVEEVEQRHQARSPTHPRTAPDSHRTRG